MGEAVRACVKEECDPVVPGLDALRDILDARQFLLSFQIPGGTGGKGSVERTEWGGRGCFTVLGNDKMGWVAEVSDLQPPDRPPDSEWRVAARSGLTGLLGGSEVRARTLLLASQELPVPGRVGVAGWNRGRPSAHEAA
jgi:hypothetical protein